MHNAIMNSFLILLGLMGPVAVLAQVCNPNIPASTPTSSFIVSGNGTATDSSTGLMWKRCSEGQTWNGATCIGTVSSYSWQAALQRAKTVNDGGGYAGHADWRLPNIKELRSLVEEKCYSPSINGTVFPATSPSSFWSASANANDWSSAWNVTFSSGYAGNNGKPGGGLVRLVRSGQSFDTFAGGVCTAGGTVPGQGCPVSGLSLTWPVPSVTSNRLGQSYVSPSGITFSEGTAPNGFVDIRMTGGIPHSIWSFRNGNVFGAVSYVGNSWVWDNFQPTDQSIPDGVYCFSTASSYDGSCEDGFFILSKGKLFGLDFSNQSQSYAQFNDGSPNRHHSGIDIPAPVGTGVVAAAGGTIKRYLLSDNNSRTHCMGNVVIIDHGGSATLYSHLDTIDVATDTVVQGQRIGTVGSKVGYKAQTDQNVACDPVGAHLHFELKDQPFLGTTSDGGVTWGYTPESGVTGTATPIHHPDAYGFHDPILNLHAGIMGLSPVTVTVTPDGAGASMRTGPDTSYRAIGLNFVAGSQFTALWQFATATPNCSGGWYQIRRTDAQYFVDVNGGSLPAAWVCRGNAGQVWLATLVGAEAIGAIVRPMVGADGAHSVAIRSDGSLWAWGQNGSGQLGDGTTIASLIPKQIGTGYAAVAAGSNYTLALKLDGSLLGWGYNPLGNLGDGTTTNILNPKQIGTGYAAIAAGGNFHTLALKADGGLWAWGSNEAGQLGDGTTTMNLAPKQIGIGYTAVAVGGLHSIALKSDGSLWAWGQNGFGELGDGTTNNSLLPKRIGTGYRAIAAGTWYTIALKLDGSLWAWGRNTYGQLGDGTRNNSLVPKRIGSGFVAISVKEWNSIALKSDGSLWAWGNNDRGQLGDGTISDKLVPTQIGSGYSAISSGTWYTLGVKTDGSLWAWGDNNGGQQGNGATSTAPVVRPQQVLGPDGVAYFNLGSFSLATGTLSGVVSDAQTGRGIANAAVRFGSHWAATDASGHFALPLLQPSADTFTVSLAGYATYTTTANPATTSVMNVSLAPDFSVCTPGSVSGIVKDATTGSLLPSVSVTLAGTTAGTNGSGQYSFAGVAAGTRMLAVSLTGYSNYSQPVNVCGDVTQDIRLTRNNTVRGTQTPAGMSPDPVNTATGNYTYQRQDINLPGKGLAFAFERSYNSQDADTTSGPLGFGWSHNYHVRLSVGAGGVVQIHWGDGKVETYAPDGSGGFTAQYGVFDTLAASGGGAYTLTRRNRTVYGFNAAGLLISIVDRNGNTISLNYTGVLLTRVSDTAGRNVDFNYDGSGRITQLTDPLSRTVLFTYDVSGDLVSATDMRGNITRYSYDSLHQILTVTDPRGNVLATNTYDADKRVVTAQKDAKANATYFIYDTLNRRTMFTDALGLTTTHYHDELHRLIREDDPLGQSQYFAYDAAGNRSTVIDRNGNRIAYGYDANGNVTSKIDQVGQSTTITYDVLSDPLARTDAAGGITTFEYDAKGNLTRTTDALGNTATVTYNAAGQPMTLTDSRGAVTTNGYDAQGNLTSVQDALGNITTHAYDAVGRRLTRTDALGRVTQFAYDANDNVVAVTDPAGKVASVTYDENNNRKTSTNKRGQVSSFTYDAKDLLTKTTDALGNAIENAYDALDRLISVKDPRGNLTQFGYDAAGRRTTSTDALGRISSAVFDANGNRTGATDALGHTTTFAYDALNRQVLASDALGNATTTAYDSLGRVATVTDAKGRVTSFGYDALGRLLTVTDAAGGTVLYAYDANGNRVSMTDPRGNVTAYQYDARNRLTRKTEPGARVTLYAYDAVGNLTSLTRPNGSAITYSYDNRDRLITVTYPDNTSVAFTYDDNGNRLSMTDALGTTSLAYDALDRLASRTDPFGQTVNYGYDAAGNRVNLTYPGAKTARYAYDALNRMVSVSDWLGRTTGYTYDSAGRLTQMTNPNGTSTTLTFDNADRLTGLSNAGPLQPIASYAYTLDPLGNHTQATVSEPLAPAIGVATVNYTYDNDNRLTSAGGVSFAYDADGNLITKGPDSFVYDFEDRLKQSTIGGVAASYQYDGTGNRLAKTVAGATTRYVLDLNGSLSKVLMETDSANTPSAYFLHGLGLVARIKPDGAASYYHYDSRGSTVALTGQNGGVTDAYAYDAFGKAAGSQGGTANPFRYVGRYGLMDEGNGVLYVRARYYDPEIGRFLSKDSKAGTDTDSQSLHRYVYAQNNSVRFIDVSGYSRSETAGKCSFSVVNFFSYDGCSSGEIERKLIYIDAAIGITGGVKEATNAILACISPAGIPIIGCLKAISDQALQAFSVFNGNSQEPMKTFEFVGSQFGAKGQQFGKTADELYSWFGQLKDYWEFNAAVGKTDPNNMLSSFEKTKDFFTKQTGPINFIGGLADRFLGQ